MTLDHLILYSSNLRILLAIRRLSLLLPFHPVPPPIIPAYIIGHWKVISSSPFSPYSSTHYTCVYYWPLEGYLFFSLFTLFLHPLYLRILLAIGRLSLLLPFHPVPPPIIPAYIIGHWKVISSSPFSPCSSTHYTCVYYWPLEGYLFFSLFTLFLHPLYLRILLAIGRLSLLLPFHPVPPPIIPAYIIGHWKVISSSPFSPYSSTPLPPTY